MDGTWNKVNIVQGVCSPAVVSERIRIKLPLKRQVLKKQKKKKTKLRCKTPILNTSLLI